MSIYQFALSLFPGTIDKDQFISALKEDFNTFESATWSDDSIYLLFSSELSEGDITAIETLCENHVADPYLNILNYPDTAITGGPDTYSINTEYTLVKVFIYPGKTKTGYPGEIHLIATIEDGVTSGSVRLYDITNHKTIAELTNITCTTPQILSMEFNHADLPVNQAEIGVQLKRTTTNTSKKIVFHSLLLDYSP